MSVTDVTNPIRILLVEDNPHDRRVFHRAFRKSEIPTEITDCKRAEEALDRLVVESDQYDLVVSDHGLPGNSGLDLYRQLREQQIGLPFVLLTGVGNELLAVEALKLGVHDYLPKNAGQAYVEQLPTSIARVYQVHHDRIQKATIEAELEQRDAKEQFLSEATATALLAAMDDYETTVAKLAQLPIPFFADWSLLDLLNQNGTDSPTVAVHADREGQALLDRLTEVIGTNHEAGEIAAEVIHSAKPRLISNIIDPGDLFGEGTSGIIEALNPQSLICTPLVVQDRVLGVLWLVYSDSHRRFHEKDLAFAERIGQRAAIAIENARVYAAVRETDRRKDEFLAMLAHELRNPLAPVRSGLAILKDDNADPILAGKAIATMERQVEHMVRLVDDLLDLSRVMRGKITLHRKRVSLDSIIERALELVQPLIESRQHELVVNLPPAKVSLDVDEARITQILANLLTNSAKYTDPGGHIWLQCDVENDELAMRVRDDGIGIDLKMLPHVFGLFQQVESSLDRSHGGLGIGLTLVRTLTEMHDGTVSAHSDGLGRGSEFMVRLPIAEVTQQSKSGRTGETQSGQKNTGLRIFVVDDNVDAADMLSALLQLDGHQVATANDGRVALQTAGDFGPDVIVLDIGMPGMNGYEVAQEFRRRGQFRQTLIIAVTGFGQDMDRQRALDAGFDHHLVKPVAPHEIREVLAEHGENKPTPTTATNSSSD